MPNRFHDREAYAQGYEKARLQQSKSAGYVDAHSNLAAEEDRQRAAERQARDEVDGRMRSTIKQAASLGLSPLMGARRSAKAEMFRRGRIAPRAEPSDYAAMIAQAESIYVTACALQARTQHASRWSVREQGTRALREAKATFVRVLAAAPGAGVQL